MPELGEVNNAELKKLYDGIIPNRDIGDYETFSGKMQTEKERRAFFDATYDSGMDLGDYAEYEKRLKKKGTASESLPSEESESETPSTKRAGETITPSWRGKSNTSIPIEKMGDYQKWEHEQAPNKESYDKLKDDERLYDIKGYFQSKDKYKNNDKGYKMDLYKKPSHPTFSNQSKYSTDKAEGGQWLKVDGKKYFRPSEANLKNYSPDYYEQYFQDNGIESGLIINNTVVPPPETAGKSYDKLLSRASNGIGEDMSKHPDEFYDAANLKFTEPKASDYDYEWESGGTKSVVIKPNTLDPDISEALISKEEGKKERIAAAKEKAKKEGEGLNKFTDEYKDFEFQFSGGDEVRDAMKETMKEKFGVGAAMADAYFARLDERMIDIKTNQERVDQVDQLKAIYPNYDSEKINRQLSRTAILDVMQDMSDTDKQLISIQRQIDDITKEKETSELKPDDYAIVQDLLKQRNELSDKELFYNPLTGERIVEPTEEDVERKEGIMEKSQYYYNNFKGQLDSLFIDKYLWFKSTQDKYSQMKKDHAEGVAARMEGLGGYSQAGGLNRQQSGSLQKAEQRFVQAKGELDAVSRAYLLNENPADIEKGVSHMIGIFGKALATTLLPEDIVNDLQANDAISSNDRTLLNYSRDALVGEIPFSDEDVEKFDQSFLESASELGGGLTGMAIQLAGLRKVGSGLGWNRLLNAIETSKKLSKGKKGLAISMLKAGYEETAFQMVGGSPGAGAGFYFAGKMIPVINLQGRLGTTINPYVNTALKGSVGGTIGMEAATITEATVDAFMNDTDWQYSMEKHGYGSFDEVEQRLLTGLFVNWIYGAAHMNSVDFTVKPEKLDNLADKLENKGDYNAAKMARMKAMQMRLYKPPTEGEITKATAKVIEKGEAKVIEATESKPPEKAIGFEEAKEGVETLAEKRARLEAKRPQTTLETPSSKDFNKYEEQATEIEFENKDDMKLILDRKSGDVIGVQNRKGDKQLFNEEAAKTIIEKEIDTDGFVSKSGNQTVEFKEGVLEVKSSDGAEVSETTRRKVTKEYEDQFDYQSGEAGKVTEGTKSSEDADTQLIESTKNPKELVDIFDRNNRQVEDAVRDVSREDLMADYIGSVDRNSYTRFGDKNKITMGLAKSWFKKGGSKIDRLAEELTEDTGQEFTPNDIVEFIEQYPGGAAEYRKEQNRSPISEAAAEKFREITGLELNERTSQKAREQGLQKQNIPIQEFYGQDYKTREELERAFDKWYSEQNTDEAGNIISGAREIQESKKQEVESVVEKESIEDKVTPETEREFTEEAIDQFIDENGVDFAESEAGKEMLDLVRTSARKKFREAEGIEEVPEAFEKSAVESSEAILEDSIMRDIDLIRGGRAPKELGTGEKLTKLMKDQPERFEEVQTFYKEALAEYRKGEEQVAEDLSEMESRLESLKIGKGGELPGALIIAPKIWNTAIEIAKRAVRLGSSIKKAIQKAVEYIKGNQKPEEEFNEGEYKKYFENSLKGKKPKAAEKNIETVKEYNKTADAEEAEALVGVGSESGFMTDMGKKTKSFFKEYFTVEGSLPADVFQRELQRKGAYKARLRDIKFTGSEFKSEFKKAYPKPTAVEIATVDAALKGEVDINTLPENLHAPMRAMRNQIDAMSRLLIKEGMVEGDLIPEIQENLGVYMTRSYRAHEDPAWAEEVPYQIRNRAKSFMRDQYKELYPEMKESEMDEVIEGQINNMLYSEDAPMAIMKGGKLGAKDLGILKKRGDIPPEIRALLGEYKDPLVNYAKTITKQADLIEKTRMLKDIRVMGKDNFLFDKPSSTHYVKLAADASKVMHPLNGLYTTPEIKQAFEKYGEVSAMSAFGRAYMKINGYAKYTKTVLSYMTHTRNLIGNIGFAVANGHVQGGKMVDAVKVTIADIAKTRKGEFREKVKEYIELGVLDEGARAGELEEVIQDANGRKADFESIVDGTANRYLRKGQEFATDLYQAEDGVWKIYAFENELSRYKKAYPDGDIVELKKKAAHIVRSTYPTYSLIPKAVKEIRKIPLFGTFVSFPAEVIRTSVNTVDLAIKEMKNPETAAIGIQRMAGILAATSLSGALSLISKNAYDITEQEDEDIKRFAAPWSKNSQLIYLDEGGEGKYRYVDISYSDPHGYLKQIVTSALNGEDFIDGAIEAAKTTLEPFFGEEMLIGKIREVMSNKKASGSNVYNPQGSVGDITYDVYRHISSAVEPGTMTSLRRNWKAINGITDNYGKEYDPADELIALFAGQRRVPVDTEQAFKFKSFKFKKDFGDAKRIYSKVFFRKGTKTDAEVEDAYMAANEAARDLFDEMLKDYDANVRLGVSGSNLQSALQESGISKDMRAQILSGKFKPISRTPGKKKSKKKKSFTSAFGDSGGGFGL